MRSLAMKPIDPADSPGDVPAAAVGHGPVSTHQPAEGSNERLEALKALFEEHSKLIYRAAYRVTGNSTDAEDVVQTIFLRLLKRGETVDLGATAGSYLYRAAVNAGLDSIRSRGRRRAVDLDGAEHEVEASSVAPSVPTPESNLEGREVRGLICSALAEISPRAAEIFALRYFEGYGNTEIAKMFDTSRSSIAVTLHRTRNRLKEELGSVLGVTS